MSRMCLQVPIVGLFDFLEYRDGLRLHRGPIPLKGRMGGPFVGPGPVVSVMLVMPSTLAVSALTPYYAST